MKWKVVFIVSFICSVTYAQNLPRYGQVNFTNSLINPAAVAVDAKYQVDLIFRNQWYKFEGAPTTFAANAQYEISNDMAVGLNFYHDRIGVVQDNAVMGQYAYRVLFEQANALILGVGVGFESKTADYTSTVTTTPGDPAFGMNYSKIFFQSSVGVYYYSPIFYAGFSIPQMFQTNFGEGDGFDMGDWHSYFVTGWYLEAGPNYTFNPNIQLKIVQGAPIQGDLVLRNTFSGRWSIIVGYRSENSLIAGVDALITPFMRAGYSFNYDVGQLSRVKGMSNEVHLGFGLPYRNSRYDFGNRQYINKKGGFHREYKRRYNRRMRR